MIEPIAFGIVAACMLLSALLVATAKKPVHGVLWLGVTLGSTAVLYLLLRAPFVATVQLLLYVGGVMTLMIFGVMLVRRPDGKGDAFERKGRVIGALLAAIMFGVIAAAVQGTRHLPDHPSGAPSTARLGRSILGEHMLAFEILSLLLLAAMIGAIVVTRRRGLSSLERLRRAAAGEEPPA